MCGIFGQLNVRGDPVDRAPLEAMGHAIAHRGPDDHGLQHFGSITLGHHRLSIIDRSPAGHQPMANHDGTAWITFNGEIYNFEELRDRHVRAYPFRSRTDTEVILALWERYQERCLEHLRGMFAFAIWDRRREVLFLARDRVGEKPLKYFFDGRHFIFASELKALVRHPLVTPRVDLPAIHACLRYNHVPAPQTGFLGIAKLPAGHCAVLRDGTLSIQRYWGLDFRTKTSLTYQEASVETLRLLRESVRLRLVADVPVGAFLSGGIDSSAVVALMSEGTHRVRTFSIGFPDTAFDERGPARTVARQFGTDHTEFEVVPNAVAVLPQLVAQYEEPYADSSALPIYYLAEQTRRSVTIALSGDGGDEAFGGYRRYLYWHALHRFRPHLYERIATHFYCGDRFRHLFTRAFLTTGPSRLAPSPPHPPALRTLDDVFALSFDTFLPDDLLAKVDIATMAFGLEARAPFLDHHLLEFSAALPPRWKVRGWRTKAILKHALRPILPKTILSRRKHGFELPVNRWFQHELSPWAMQILLDRKSLDRGYFQPHAIEQLLREHREGRARHGQRIWALLCLELWHRSFIDSAPL